jgi:CHAT domain-containing protein
MISCNWGSKSPELQFEDANRAFVRGDLKESQQEAERGYQIFRRVSPEWAWRFRILEARSAVWRGLYREVLKILKTESPPSDRPDLVIAALSLIGVSDAYIQDFPEAERVLNQAAKLCNTVASPSCGDLFQSQGLLASQQRESKAAERLYGRSLVFARARGDTFLESSSLLNLGDEALAQGHLDQSIDLSESAYRVARTIDARIVEIAAQGNIGWAHYRLGDSEKALDLFVGAQKLADQLGDFSDQENELTNIGYVYMDEHRFDLAAKSFRQALDLAESINSTEDTYNALRVMARFALQVGDAETASKYARQALDIARKSGNHLDELYPTLVQGQVAARRGDAAEAKQAFEAVEQDPECPVFLKWEAQHSLARLDEDQKRPEIADSEYRAALATFETARAAVRREDFQISFLTNAAHIYDDYVHFLVSRKKPDEALRWADYSRARTLLEGLGLLSRVSRNKSLGPPPVNPREISRRAKGVLLFYWLGEKQSYLWAITPQKINLFPLPPGAEIESMVQRYSSALQNARDVLQSSEEARALYRTLIEPAKALLVKDAKVFIIPDGSLNNLNFETLVVADPNPRFWIEDADVTSASSLRVLNASFVLNSAARNSRETKQPRRLLLIGDSVAPSKQYPELPRAAQQMANVAKHFPAAKEQVYQRAQATPSAYLDTNPEKYSHIHFVAHGTASRLSPLDSAIVLSRGAPDKLDQESFKLYARDIVPHHLNADLVTISACTSAGERAYSGEGLVGLAWAFLRAGAHNVIAALWDVTDASTEQLMDRFYEELDKGASPNAALRTAKLSLLRGSPFHSPFYWAPFQLYTGS